MFFGREKGFSGPIRYVLGVFNDIISRYEKNKVVGEARDSSLAESLEFIAFIEAMGLVNLPLLAR